MADKPVLKFLYLFCNNLEEMHRFYCKTLEMPEVAYMQDYFCGVECGGLQLMIFPSPEPVPVAEEWSNQPGWNGGELLIPSWSIIIPMARFGEVVENLKRGGAPAWSKEPFWEQDSYWCFPVRDPMGNTVEVCGQPDERPKSTTWPGDA